MTRKLLPVLALSVVGIAPVANTAPAAPVATWKIIDLGQGLEPRDINNKGQIVVNGNPNADAGARANRSYIAQLDRRDRVKLLPLTTFRGFTTEAHRLNDRGLVCGLSEQRGYRHTRQACVWINRRIRRIRPPSLTTTSFAHDVSNDGVVIGADTNGLLTWSRNRTTITPQPNEFDVSLTEINDQGLMAGGAWERAAGSRGQAVVFKSGVFTRIEIPGLQDSEVASINNAGHLLIGGTHEASTLTSSYSAVWVNGTSRELPELPGTHQDAATAMNASDEAVGTSLVGPQIGQLQYRAVYWSAAGAIEDLNDRVVNPEWVLQQAYAINDRGWIVGMGLRNGKYHGWLLKR